MDVCSLSIGEWFMLPNGYKVTLNISTCITRFIINTDIYNVLCSQCSQCSRSLCCVYRFGFLCTCFTLDCCSFSIYFSFYLSHTQNVSQFCCYVSLFVSFSLKIYKVLNLSTFSVHFFHLYLYALLHEFKCDIDT